MKSQAKKDLHGVDRKMLRTRRPPHRFAPGMSEESWPNAVFQMLRFQPEGKLRPGAAVSAPARRPGPAHQRGGLRPEVSFVARCGPGRFSAIPAESGPAQLERRWSMRTNGAGMRNTLLQNMLRSFSWAEEEGAKGAFTTSTVAKWTGEVRLLCCAAAVPAATSRLAPGFHCQRAGPCATPPCWPEGCVQGPLLLRVEVCRLIPACEGLPC